MSQGNAITADGANFGSEGGFGNRRRALRLNADVMQKARDFWPIKTALHLSEITNYSTRAAENWLSGRAVIPTDALAALMQSEQGRDFLAVVMADNTPRWWVMLKAWMKRLTYEAAQRHQEKLLRELIDDAAARPGPHSAFVSDWDFHEGQPSPVRAVASKKRDRR